MFSKINTLVPNEIVSQLYTSILPSKMAHNVYKQLIFKLLLNLSKKLRQLKAERLIVMVSPLDENKHLASSILLQQGSTPAPISVEFTV
jgi:hypothetical protein